MIQFTLKCDGDHRFESWFQSAQAFDKLSASGMVACSVCGSTRIEKAPMAPSVVSARDKSRADANDAKPLTRPASPAEQALAELKKQIETHSEYVGTSFAREARAIHDGTAPERPIYGEAKPDEARRLVEDGVPVTPLPFMPNRKSN